MPGSIFPCMPSSPFCHREEYPRLQAQKVYLRQKIPFPQLWTWKNSSAPPSLKAPWFCRGLSISVLVKRDLSQSKELHIRFALTLPLPGKNYFTLVFFFVISFTTFLTIFSFSFFLSPLILITEPFFIFWKAPLPILSFLLALIVIVLADFIL